MDSKDFHKREYINLDCSAVCIRLEGNISPPIRYSYLPILCDDKADIFAASLLILYCTFFSLKLSSIFFSKRFFLERKGLSDLRLTSVTKKWGFVVHFVEYDFAKIIKPLNSISDE